MHKTWLLFAELHFCVAMRVITLALVLLVVFLVLAEGRLKKTKLAAFQVIVDADKARGSAETKKTAVKRIEVQQRAGDESGDESGYESDFEEDDFEKEMAGTVLPVSAEVLAASSKDPPASVLDEFQRRRDRFAALSRVGDDDDESNTLAMIHPLPGQPVRLSPTVAALADVSSAASSPKQAWTGH